MGKKIVLTLAFLLISIVPALAGSGQKAPPEPPQGSLAVDTPVSTVGSKNSSGLPIPRFVTLATDKVFVRTGPALRYPIKWVLQKEHLPVEIVQEFDTWRKIRDMEGDDGWVHQSMLSGNRSIVVKGEANMALKKDPDTKSRTLAYLEPHVIAGVEECRGAWCAVSSEGYKGWAERKFLWGIYDSEDFD